jgi:hypothetical protein
MPTDEAARLHLYERARDAMDDDAARTLMSALPWDVTELATKQDLLATKQELVAMRHDVEAAIAKAKWSIVLATLTMNATLVGAVVSVVQLVR